MDRRYPRVFQLLLLTLFFSRGIGVAGATEPTALFDGTSLDGWMVRGGKATYEVVDGTIVGTSAPNTPNTFLCTERDYADFELTYEFKCDPELNSGVQIRSQCFDEPRHVERDGKKFRFDAGRVHGYQVEIDPNTPKRLWVGGIYDEARRGWLFPGKRGGDAEAFTQQGQRLFRPGEWNAVKVVCRGDHIQTWLNGEPRADFHDDFSAEGFIGLQVHGVGGRQEPLQVRWRNIHLRELNVGEPSHEASHDSAP